ncbi:response regulator transcription factor [Kitasatospora sp. NPDC088391]|uniref:response regulator transcription factor n=1 Tax=Kitasatospora sp. NPDC088391 TaxID=3364074 RepID=UPI00382EBA68
MADRERETVTLPAGGGTDAEIAAHLFLATGTVENHVASVQRKLGVRSRVGIAARAWQHGACRP